MSYSWSFEKKKILEKINIENKRILNGTEGNRKVLRRQLEEFVTAPTGWLNDKAIKKKRYKERVIHNQYVNFLHIEYVYL